MGCSEEQIAELKETINSTPCDVVVIDTPIGLRRVMTFDKATARVRYELKVLGPVYIEQVLEDFIGRSVIKWAMEKRTFHV